MKIIIQGNQIYLCRYKVVYKENDKIITEYFPTQKEVEKITSTVGGEIELLETKDFEWIDGVKIPETNQPMEKALEIIAMGEAGYKKWIEQQELQRPEKLVEENEKLKQQLTDMQIALVEVYEKMLEVQNG